MEQNSIHINAEYGEGVDSKEEAHSFEFHEHGGRVLLAYRVQLLMHYPFRFDENAHLRLTAKNRMIQTTIIEIIMLCRKSRLIY